MKQVLVTGAHGQLGTELNFLSSLLETHSFVFVGRDDLNIADEKMVDDFFEKHSFDVVVNPAAYTAVDKAEAERGLAYAVNAVGAGNIAKACSRHKIKLFHFSTDFVFDGSLSRPYLETDITNPLSVYGSSKLDGEALVMKHNPDTVLIRTGWIYSSFGHNFVKTILRLCKERESLGVVYDQVGTPTYARDLADVVLQLIQLQDWKPGVYHYSNEGVASWYDFALAIREFAGLNTRINPIETYQYPTPAERPAYSVLCKQKIKQTFGIEIPYWRNSLKKCVCLLA